MFARLAHMRHESRMGRAALAEMHARLREAERAIDGEVNIAGVFVFLAVIFPPAHGAQGECAGRVESTESATRAAVIGVHPRGWTAARASGLHPAQELAHRNCRRRGSKRSLRGSESEDKAGVEAGVVSSTGRLGGRVDAVGGKSPGKEGKNGEIDAAAQIVSERST
jgi:hypothetical protein